MRFLRAARSILRIQMMGTLQFRAAAWARTSTFLFYGFVHVVLIQIFYTYGTNAGADFTSQISKAQAVSYVWLIQVMASLLPQMSTDKEVWQKIRSGDVGIELCRPLDLYVHWFVRAVASRLGPFLLQVLPITLLAMFLPEPFRLQPPASLAGLTAAVVAAWGALLLSAACVSLSYSLLMKVSWGEGPTHIVLGVMGILAGSELPLQLWPQWAQGFLLWQPFAGLLDLPLRLYVGTMPPGALAQVLAIQATWTIGFILLGRLLMARHLTRMVIQGG